MRIVVFVGPTLSPQDARAVLDAEYLPPVSQGDVYRVAREEPAAIGIIDGVFEQVPAVWHKEILWALARGIHVFGAASMGALRAAELASFGMVGVGTIFQAFHEGTLEDDDEVAVGHGDSSQGFRPTSEAMVNIRSTLRAGVAAGALDEAAAAHLERLGKQMHYTERTFPALLAEARRAGVAAEGLPRLEAFLPGGRVNQKRLDALAMLRAMADARAELAARKVVTFQFEHTDTWQHATSALDAQRPPRGDDLAAAALTEELRLRPPLFRAAYRGAMLRASAERQAARERMLVTADLRDVTQDLFRRERGLEESAAIWQWLRDNELDAPGFGRLLESEARLRWLTALYRSERSRHLKTELVTMGDYPAIAARARHKQDMLAQSGLEDPTLADAHLTEAELLRWYFVERLGRAEPVNVAAYLAEVDLAGAEDLRREALREYVYLRLTHSAP